MNLWLGLGLSYFLGAIPTAYLFGRVLKGVDIRRHGSGNVGATNAFRVLGKGPGILVLLIDILKGTMAVALVGRLLSLDGIIECVLLGLAAVCGHNWTIFLRFKGGKGIATSLGVLVGLAMKFAVLRPVLAAAVLVWVVMFLASGYVSLASVTAAVALPVVMVMTHQVFEMLILGFVFCIFVVVRHRSNMQRLCRGQEPKVRLFGRKNGQHP